MSETMSPTATEPLPKAPADRSACGCGAAAAFPMPLRRRAHARQECAARDGGPAVALRTVPGLGVPQIRRVRISAAVTAGAAAATMAQGQTGARRERRLSLAARGAERRWTT